MEETSIHGARVALVDELPLFRIGLRHVLEDDARFTVAFETGSPAEAIARAGVDQLDGATVDLASHEMSAPALISALCGVHARIKILVLSILDEPLRIAEALRAGATGYAHKCASPDVIRDALARVLLGERYLPADCPQREIERFASGLEPWPLDRLTGREKEVFDLMVDGCSNEEIAERLFIARRTVETHRHHVMHKLEARSIVDLVRIAMRYGISVGESRTDVPARSARYTTSTERSEARCVGRRRSTTPDAQNT